MGMNRKNTTALVWLRQDLRLHDNPALHHACSHYEQVVPVYVFDDTTPKSWKMGGAQCWWLHQSLTELKVSLEGISLPLVITKGKADEVLEKLIQSTGAAGVFWNRCYEPYAIARDATLKETLLEKGLEAKSFNGSLLFEPWEIKNKQGSWFKVFTPFWKHCLTLDPGEALPAPKPKAKQTLVPASLAVANLNLLPTKPDWAGGMRKAWKPGERNARKQLEVFIDEAVAAYGEQRDVPAVRGTSRLSPYLHMGEISPRQIWHAIRARAEGRGADKYLAEIGWREFSYHLLYHFPELPQKPFNSRFSDFPWEDNPKLLKAWQRGNTGYPIVDAGMRELWETGWMHNRVRMIVASFLTKHLLIPWQEGAAWFWDTLLDADLASNSASWQWVAGSGADAAPYFRIFNPILQGKKFDPEGEYVRRYVPELAKLPVKHIHAPWEAPEDVLKQAGIVLGKNYPKPVVGHDFARGRALAAFKSLGKN
jgi:deoxyribodipyrimidine photo-lyase